MAVYGMLAALVARGVTGRGQAVGVSMTAGMMALMAPHAGEWLFAGREPQGGHYFNAGGAAAYECYRCADGRFITLGGIEQHFWDRLRALVAPTKLPDDPLAPGDEADRARAVLVEVFRTRSACEWLALMRRHDIPAGPVNGFADAFADPQMQAREMLQWMDHPVEGHIPQLGFPVKFSNTPGEMRRPPPVLGEHTDEILADLDYSAVEIARMRDDGVV